MSTVIILALLGLLASVSPSTIVVFILLLATTRPRTGRSSSSSIRTVGWNRVSGPHGSSTTSQPSAVRMLRYAG